MPIYTYACTACHAAVEKRQSFTDVPLTVCDVCGGSLRKEIHPVGIVFKGSGWYVTDSRAAPAKPKDTTKEEKPAATGATEEGAAKSEKTESKNESSSKERAPGGDGGEPAAKPAESKPAATEAAPAKT